MAIDDFECVGLGEHRPVLSVACQLTKIHEAYFYSNGGYV